MLEMKIFADIIVLSWITCSMPTIVSYKVNKIRSDLLELEERHYLIRNEIQYTPDNSNLQGTDENGSS